MFLGFAYFSFRKRKNLEPTAPKSDGEEVTDYYRDYVSMDYKYKAFAVVVELKCRKIKKTKGSNKGFSESINFRLWKTLSCLYGEWINFFNKRASVLGLVWFNHES